MGASRGLGEEFVRQYLADGWRVIATARKKTDLSRLAKLGAEVKKLDVTKAADFTALKRALARRTIDVAIYNSGVYGSGGEGIGTIEQREFDQVMRTNVWGAMRAVPVVAPAVAKSKGTFVFLSSIMGSIASMENPWAVTYRASKAALNMVTRLASIYWQPKDVTMLVLHPGWVKTDMGGKNAEIERGVSIAGMRRVIAEATPKQNGMFLDYQGNTIPW